MSFFRSKLGQLYPWNGNLPYVQRAWRHPGVKGVKINHLKQKRTHAWRPTGLDSPHKHYFLQVFIWGYQNNWGLYPLTNTGTSPNIRPSSRPLVDGTAVLPAVRRRDGGLERRSIQGRDGTVFRPSVRPTVLDGYGDDPYLESFALRRADALELAVCSCARDALGLHRAQNLAGPHALPREVHGAASALFSAPATVRHAIKYIWIKGQIDVPFETESSSCDQHITEIDIALIITTASRKLRWTETFLGVSYPAINASEPTGGVFDVHEGDRFACMADLTPPPRQVYRLRPLVNSAPTLMFESTSVCPSPALEDAVPCGADGDKIVEELYPPLEFFLLNLAIPGCNSNSAFAIASSKLLLFSTSFVGIPQQIS
ncbi:hypothetical protein DFH09DRAFT_1081936 [Mycena vulgaris]|nr:hypothetical protein DFH09DRAFT_1081936 [Mycena vulgaris]